MKPTKLEWEDVIQFEEIEGYGKSIWKRVKNNYVSRIRQKSGK